MAVGFSEIPEVLEELRQGRMIVLVDAEDRENEGDLVCAAEKVTPEVINFMAKYGRGLICLPLTAEKCDSLGLYPQTTENTARFGTAFVMCFRCVRERVACWCGPARPKGQLTLCDWHSSSRPALFVRL
jgi:3,4-dihydroxy 2-butanone 4-phosphate synthase/GTP cyclohydrolase II